TAPVQVVVRGEAAVALSFSPYCEAARGAGHDVEVVIPRDGTAFEVGAVAVLADAPHPESAREYVDYALSADGQQAAAGIGIPQIPTRRDLPGNLGEVLADDRFPVISSSLADRADRRDALLHWFVEDA